MALDEKRMRERWQDRAPAMLRSMTGPNGEDCPTPLDRRWLWRIETFLAIHGTSDAHRAMARYADEYRLVIPSDLLTRHALLSPDETPVTPTGDQEEHRSHRPVPPVTESGSPVTESQNTGHGDRTPTQYQPLPEQDQRDESVEDVTTRGDDSRLYARLYAIDQLAARKAASQ